MAGSLDRRIEDLKKRLLELAMEDWPVEEERRKYWEHYYSKEQVRAREDESKRRDIEFLQRNRASVGLLPLTLEELVYRGYTEGQARTRMKESLDAITESRRAHEK